MSVKRRLVSAVVALVVTGLVCASAAYAYEAYAYHPSDPSYAHVWTSHWYEACDRQVDGHRVRMHYDTYAAPGEVLYSGWAPSGGCTSRAGTTGGATVRSFRICVEAEGCGPWKGDH